MSCFPSSLTPPTPLVWLLFTFFFFFYCSINFHINTFTKKEANHLFNVWFKRGEKEEEVGAELSVNLKLSWRHFLFFLILQPDSKNSISSSGCTVTSRNDLSSRSASDAPCLDAVFSSHPGESFHTAEKLLHAFFRQEQLECTGASDFPCERLMIGLIWRGFMDYGALAFSENRSVRWKELSRGWKAERKNIWRSSLKMNNGDLPFVFALVLFSGTENSGRRWQIKSVLCGDNNPIFYLFILAEAT